MFDAASLPERLSDQEVDLRRLDPEGDSAALFGVLPPSVWEHIPGGVPTSPDALAARLVNRMAEDGRITWVITDSGRVVGTSSHIPAGDGAEIGGTYLAPDRWGSGLNSRLKAVMIQASWAAGARWIRFRTDERNIRSARSITKTGAQPAGTCEEEWIRPDGTRRTSLLFVLYRAVEVVEHDPNRARQLDEERTAAQAEVLRGRPGALARLGDEARQAVVADDPEHL